MYNMNRMRDLKPAVQASCTSVFDFLARSKTLVDLARISDGCPKKYVHKYVHILFCLEI